MELISTQSEKKAPGCAQVVGLKDSMRVRRSWACRAWSGSMEQSIMLAEAARRRWLTRIMAEKRVGGQRV